MLGPLALVAFDAKQDRHPERLLEQRFYADSPRLSTGKCPDTKSPTSANCGQVRSPLAMPKARDPTIHALLITRLTPTAVTSMPSQTSALIDSPNSTQACSAAHGGTKYMRLVT